MSILKTIYEANEVNQVVVAIWNEEARAWYFTYTVGEKDDPKFTVTVYGSSLFALCRTAEEAIHRIDSDFAAGKLMLPDMGDWQVEYFGD